MSIKWRNAARSVFCKNLFSCMNLSSVTSITKITKQVTEDWTEKLLTKYNCYFIHFFDKISYFFGESNGPSFNSFSLSPHMD